MEYFSHRLTRLWILNRLYRYAMNAYPAYAQRRFGAVAPEALVRLGSDYGGWYVPLAALGPDAVVYSAGVGQDVSFDLDLVARCGCAVHAFDPTPAAIDYVTRLAAENPLMQRFHFNPVGLWDEETTLRFFAPKTRGWVGSYSALNLQGTDEAQAIDAPVKRLSTLMRERGHTALDLLKIDIEGAEYRVIDEIVDKRIPIRWLCIEFDQPVPFWTTNRALRRLRAAGFMLCRVDRWNFVFRHATAGGAAAP